MPPLKALAVDFQLKTRHGGRPLANDAYFRWSSLALTCADAVEACALQGRAPEDFPEYRDTVLELRALEEKYPELINCQFPVPDDLPRDTRRWEPGLGGPDRVSLNTSVSDEYGLRKELERWKPTRILCSAGPVGVPVVAIFDRGRFDSLKARGQMGVLDVSSRGREISAIPQRLLFPAPYEDHDRLAVVGVLHLTAEALERFDYSLAFANSHYIAAKRVVEGYWQGHDAVEALLDSKRMILTKRLGEAGKPTWRDYRALLTPLLSLSVRLRVTREAARDLRFHALAIAGFGSGPLPSPEDQSKALGSLGFEVPEIAAQANSPEDALDFVRSVRTCRGEEGSPLGAVLQWEATDRAGRFLSQRIILYRFPTLRTTHSGVLRGARVAVTGISGTARTEVEQLLLSEAAEIVDSVDAHAHVLVAGTTADGQVERALAAHVSVIPQAAVPALAAKGRAAAKGLDVASRQELAVVCAHEGCRRLPRRGPLPTGMPFAKEGILYVFDSDTADVDVVVAVSLRAAVDHLNSPRVSRQFARPRAYWAPGTRTEVVAASPALSSPSTAGRSGRPRLVKCETDWIDIPAGAGVYRILLSGSAESPAGSVYIGRSSNFRVRPRHHEVLPKKEGAVWWGPGGVSEIQLIYAKADGQRLVWSHTDLDEVEERKIREARAAHERDPGRFPTVLNSTRGRNGPPSGRGAAHHYRWSIDAPAGDAGQSQRAP